MNSKLVADLKRLSEWLENKQFIGDVPGNLDLSNIVGIMREAAVVIEWQSAAIAQLEGRQYSAPYDPSKDPTLAGGNGGY
jgi:hypothetical protein